MPAKFVEKIGCLNPNSGDKMKIDAEIYDNFSRAIYDALKQ